MSSQVVFRGQIFLFFSSSRALLAFFLSSSAFSSARLVGQPSCLSPLTLLAADAWPEVRVLDADALLDLRIPTSWLCPVCSSLRRVENDRNTILPSNLERNRRRARRSSRSTLARRAGSTALGRRTR